MVCGYLFLVCTDLNGLGGALTYGGRLFHLKQRCKTILIIINEDYVVVGVATKRTHREFPYLSEGSPKKPWRI